MLETLIAEGNQNKTLVSLIAIPHRSNAVRPRYLSSQDKDSNLFKRALGLETSTGIMNPQKADEDILYGLPELHTLDIISVALKMN